MAGLLDFLNTPQGNALASGVATYMATARRGQPINSLGRGVLGGITGYQNAISSQQEAQDRANREAYNKRMMDYNMTQAETSRMKALSEQQRLMQQKQAEKATAKMLLPGFLRTSGMQGQGFDIDEDGNLVPAEAPNMMPVSANLDWIDAGDEYKAMIGQAMQSEDPSVRRQAINEMYRYYRDQRKNTKEAKDFIAKERAMAEAMGMDVGDYLKQKFNKSGGVNVTVQNYGEPKPVQLPDGSQGLVRFGKDPSAPPIVTPYMPPASDTEQMTANYADRMASAESIFDKLESGKDKGYQSWTTRGVGVLGSDALNLAMSPAQQQRRQAEDDWIRAKLRKESGAVIATDEMESERRTYFPYPGDTPATIRQKAEARKQAVKGMYKASGPAVPRASQAPAKQSTPQKTMQKPGVKFLGFE